MKKDLLFIFLLMLCLIPLKVNAETFYFNYGEYNYSTDEVEERKDLEVVTIIEDSKTIYKYRTRDYLIIPNKIIVDSKNFDYYSLMDTNLPKEDIKFEEVYNLDEENNCNGNLLIRYGSKVISKSVYIEIKNYINVPKQIIVNNYDFNILDYVETNIKKEEIVFNGEYNLYVNGEYDITITYKEISKDTKLIVDIEENKEEVSDEVIENDSSLDLEENVSNEEIVLSEKQDEVITYVNNYYQTYESGCEERIEYVDRLVPINNETTFKQIDFNKEFRYVTYTFYVCILILLSIIVVRKK